MGKILHYYKDEWKIITTEAMASNIRIMILWKAENLEVSVLDRTSQFIHCKLRARDGSFEGLVTVVYAFNQRVERRALWDALEAKSSNINTPWVVLGDMNVVRSADEKMVEGGEVSGVTSELIDFLCEARLEDLKFYGMKHTWTNHHTWCKLDRVLVNDKWLDTYVESFARFDGYGISDHSPMVITLNPASAKMRLPFRFKNIWVQDVSYEELVQGVWGTPMYGRAMYVVTRKLRLLKQRLKQLNLNNYSKLKERVDSARERLQAAQMVLETDPYNGELQQGK